MDSQVGLTIDRQNFLEITRFVSEAVIGETLPLVTRVQAVEDQVPLILDLVAALGVALEKVESVLERSSPSLPYDAQAMRDGFTHIEQVARLEGAIAAFLAVGEEMQRRGRKKKTRKKR